MQQLQPIHEQAIDLLVSGKRQHEVAAELQISTRTLRRWGEDEKFVAELNQQHALARKLELDEATQLRREHRELQRLALQQIKSNLTDPKAPLELKKHCLRLSLMAVHFDIAQEWREFVYFDRKKEKAEAAAVQDSPAPPLQTRTVRSPGGMEMNLPTAQADIYERLMREAEEAEAVEKAAKSGHTPPQTPSAPQAAAPQGSIKNEPKADKSGQSAPNHALIDTICADVVREHSAKR